MPPHGHRESVMELNPSLEKRIANLEKVRAEIRGY